MRTPLALLASLVVLCACDGSSERPVGPPHVVQAGFSGGDAEFAGGRNGFNGVPPIVQGPASSCAQVIAPVVLPSTPHLPAFQMPVVQLEKSPPPISGGTLMLSADRTKLIAADPDRDAVYVVDVATRTLLRHIVLTPSDEPGRVVEGKAGRVYVALRGGRSIASFSLEGAAPVTRTEVCDLPRGLAYDGARDRLYIACADGALVQLDLLTGIARVPLRLGRDLRDVIVRDGRVFVTRFRSGEVIEVEPNVGTVVSVRRQPSTLQEETVFVADPPSNRTCDFGGGHTETRTVTHAGEVAWRTIDVPNRGLVMLHQRATDGVVRVTSGGYRGGGSCASGIVRGAVSVGDDGAMTADLPISGLFVDVSVDPTGSLLAVANPGARGVPGSLIVTRVPQVQVGSRDPSGCERPIAQPSLSGQVTAVAFVSEWLVAAQEREPAAISFFDVRTQDTVAMLEFNQENREDTGHTLFHVTTDAGVACASCHAEAGDDGHVWNFDGIGPRRTQNVRGGLFGSEPFHWNGDMPDFSSLVSSVFEVRMGAPPVSMDQARALGRWIDRQPALRATALDEVSVQRGKALFESEELGCTQCHSGAKLRSNESKDVGTGVILQVPSLQAVSFRAPFMHDGCANTLADRFAACGGGDKHGKTSQLQATDVGALVAYLESL